MSRPTHTRSAPESASSCFIHQATEGVGPSLTSRETDQSKHDGRADSALGGIAVTHVPYFGSVDYETEDATPAASNDLRQSKETGYHHGYGNGFPPLTSRGIVGLQLANWLVVAWRNLPTEVRELIALLESATLDEPTPGSAG